MGIDLFFWVYNFKWSFWIYNFIVIEKKNFFFIFIFLAWIFCLHEVDIFVTTGNFRFCVQKFIASLQVFISWSWICHFIVGMLIIKRTILFFHENWWSRMLRYHESMQYFEAFCRCTNLNRTIHNLTVF